MVYLMLAILCSSSIALIFKFSESNNLNRYVVTSCNYLTASIVSFSLIIFTLYKGNLKLSSMAVHSNMILLTIIIGIIAGIFFFLSFIYYQKSVRENGASLSGTFGKLGILLPMLLSIVLWKEYPNLFQWAGIILSIASILLVNLTFEKNPFKGANFTLILLFTFGGIAEFSNKIFQKYAVDEYKNIFLFFVFFTAFIISLILAMKGENTVKKPDVITGLLVGLPNLFSSFFLISALVTVKASVAFPVYSAASIILISLCSAVIFKETLPLKDIAAIIITILSLVLINF